MLFSVEYEKLKVIWGLKERYRIYQEKYKNLLNVYKDFSNNIF